jgi:phage-related tail protein
MTFQDRVLASAPRHAQLLKSLAETSNASAAAQQTEAFISQLEGQIAAETKTVERLRWKVSKERVESETLHDPRLANKPDKGEYEYTDVEAQEKVARILETLKANLQEAQAKLHGLKEAAQLHTVYQSELTSLYDNLFSPPHPPFLTLDIANSLLALAQDAHSAASKPFETARQNVQLLTDAQECYTLALNSVTNALDARRREIGWGLPIKNTFHLSRGVGLGIGIDASEPSGGLVAERNAMAMVQGQAGEAEELIRRAKCLEPKFVMDIAPTQVAYLDFWVSCGAAVGVGSQGRGGNRVQFNVVRFIEKMEVAERDLKKAVAECAREVNAARERVGLLKGKLDEARERLSDAEIGVRSAREEIIRRVVDGEDLGEDVGLDTGLFGEMRPLELLPSYVP